MHSKQRPLPSSSSFSESREEPKGRRPEKMATFMECSFPSRSYGGAGSNFSITNPSPSFSSDHAYHCLQKYPVPYVVTARRKVVPQVAHSTVWTARHDKERSGCWSGRSILAKTIRRLRSQALIARMTLTLSPGEYPLIQSKGA